MSLVWRHALSIGTRYVVTFFKEKRTPHHGFCVTYPIDILFRHGVLFLNNRILYYLVLGAQLM